MDFHEVIKQNWLTRKPDPNAINLTAILALILVGAGLISDRIVATPTDVFINHQYWRAWTALFAHGDLGHLLSNSMIFLPLTHFLFGYFGYLLFPVVGLFLGGITNLIVLKTLPPEAALLGMSGVAYWMGAAWLTLYVLVDRRESPRRRIAVAIFLAMMLFVPETFRPEVSYLSHVIGFFSGIASAVIFYFLNRKKFLAAEVKEVVFEDIELSELSNSVKSISIGQ